MTKAADILKESDVYPHVDKLVGLIRDKVRDGRGLEIDAADVRAFMGPAFAPESPRE